MGITQWQPQGTGQWTSSEESLGIVPKRSKLPQTPPRSDLHWNIAPSRGSTPKDKAQAHWLYAIPRQVTMRRYFAIMAWLYIWKKTDLYRFCKTHEDVICCFDNNINKSRCWSLQFRDFLFKRFHAQCDARPLLTYTDFFFSTMQCSFKLSFSVSTVSRVMKDY